MSNSLRPTMLPQTGELDAARALGEQLVAAYHRSLTTVEFPFGVLERYGATPVTVFQRSGVMADCDFAGFKFRAVTGFCAHDPIAVALYYTGRETADGLSCVSFCPRCGIVTGNATLLHYEQQQRTFRERAIFGMAEDRYLRRRKAAGAW